MKYKVLISGALLSIICSCWADNNVTLELSPQDISNETFQTDFNEIIKSEVSLKYHSNETLESHSNEKLDSGVKENQEAESRRMLASDSNESDSNESGDLEKHATIWRLWRPFRNWGLPALKKKLTHSPFRKESDHGGLHHHRHRDRPKLKNKIKFLFKFKQFQE